MPTLPEITNIFVCITLSPENLFSDSINHKTDKYNWLKS